MTRFFYFEPSRFSYTELQDRIREIISKEQVLERLPPTHNVAVQIEAPIPAGATLSEAHSYWVDAGNLETPAGLPRQDPNARCPYVIRVSVKCITRRSGGMSSYFGFDGYFVSLLVSVEDGKIWDARGQAAS